ncbi:hypothetical protein HUU40_26230 [candidate division KSB1 bacterium]|nr:hypothetical protein [candidate division KSB1 bacterium]
MMSKFIAIKTQRPAGEISLTGLFVVGMGYATTSSGCDKLSLRLVLLGASSTYIETEHNHKK